MFSFLLRRRDEQVYPRDEFGDELFRVFSKPEGIPREAVIWFDLYFDDEADADAMAAYFENRSYEVCRDFDDEEEDGEYGPWNVDAEYVIKPTYRELRSAVEQMRDRALSYRGKLASFVLSANDDE